MKKALKHGLKWDISFPLRLTERQARAIVETRVLPKVVVRDVVQQCSEMLALLNPHG